MSEQTLRQFLAAARDHFFGLLPAQAKLATIPVHNCQ